MSAPFCEKRRDTLMSERSEEERRVRSYLLSQGEKYTFAEMWVRLVRARLDVMASVEGVTQRQADFTPDPDEWSVSEVLFHVLTSSGRVAKLVESLSRGERPSAERIDPPREATSLSISELRERLTADAIAWSSLTERLPDEPNLDVTVPHPQFGELHAGGWYLFQRVHDLDHAGQIAKNKAAPDYPQD